jgi:uncharacterized protein YndB with AHSA1/START domain
MNSTTDRIERKILLKAPRSRVWRALANVEEFGSWFGVGLKGKAFAAGHRLQGQLTYPGYEHVVFDVVIERMEPERLLSWRWLLRQSSAPSTIHTSRPHWSCSN